MLDRLTQLQCISESLDYIWLHPAVRLSSFVLPNLYSVRDQLCVFLQRRPDQDVVSWRQNNSNLLEYVEIYWRKLKEGKVRSEKWIEQDEGGMMQSFWKKEDEKTWKYVSSKRGFPSQPLQTLSNVEDRSPEILRFSLEGSQNSLERRGVWFTAGTWKKELTDNSPPNTNHLFHLHSFNRELCFWIIHRCVAPESVLHDPLTHAFKSKSPHKMHLDVTVIAS